MLKFKQHISNEGTWQSKTIAKNTKDFTVHINTEIEPDAVYYRYYFEEGRWGVILDENNRTILGKDIISDIKRKNRSLIGTIFNLDIYLQPVELDGAKVEGVIYAPVTIRYIPERSYFFVNSNKLGIRPSLEMWDKIREKLESTDDTNVSYSLQLIEDALRFIKHEQNVFNIHVKGSEDSDLNLTGLLEARDNSSWSPYETRDVTRHVLKQVLSFPGYNYWLKSINREFLDNEPNSRNEIFSYLGSIWEAYFTTSADYFKDTIKARNKADEKFKKYYERTFTNSPEWEQWMTDTTAKPSYKKGEEETGLKMTSLLEMNEAVSSYVKDKAQYVKDEVQHMKDRPGFKYFFKWLQRNDDMIIGGSEFYETIEQWFVLMLDVYEDMYVSDPEDRLNPDAVGEIIKDSIDQRFNHLYNAFLKDTNSPEHIDWKNVEPEYKKGEDESGLKMTSLIETDEEYNEIKKKVQYMKDKPGFNYFFKWLQRTDDTLDDDVYASIEDWYFSWRDIYDEVFDNNAEPEDLKDLSYKESVVDDMVRERFLEFYDDFLKDTSSPEHIEWVTDTAARPVYKKGEEETGLKMTGLLEQQTPIKVDFTSLETVYNSILKATDVEQMLSVAEQIYKHHTDEYETKRINREPIGIGYVRSLYDFIDLTKNDKALVPVLNLAFTIYGQYIRPGTYSSSKKDAGMKEYITSQLKDKMENWRSSLNIANIHKKGSEQSGLNISALTEQEEKNGDVSPDGESILTKDNSGNFWHDKLGNPHRRNGPAIEYPSGLKFWFINGKLYRLDGPAVERADGTKEWYIDGKEYSYKDWKKEVEHRKNLADIHKKGSEDSGLNISALTEKKEKAGDVPPWVTPDGESRLRIYYNGKNKIMHWENDKGELHNRLGPAVIIDDPIGDYKMWYINGKQHREDGPAVEWGHGEKQYWLDDVRYSYEDWKKEVEHRKNLATIHKKGSEQSGLNLGALNEKKEKHGYVTPDGESTLRVDINGTKIWRNKQGQLHRRGGPAVEFTSGEKNWYVNGEPHRLDGPAIEWPDGNKLWYIDGVNYSYKDWKKEVEHLKNLADIHAKGSEDSGLNIGALTEQEEKYEDVSPDEESTLTIDGWSTKIWRNSKKQLHRRDGPAIENAYGEKEWYVNGKRHRLDGPAVVYLNGTKEWWIDGVKYSYEDWKKEVEHRKNLAAIQAKGSEQSGLNLKGLD